jgi:hypothetical protein
MCLIAASRTGKIMSEEQQKNAWSNNSDGFGIVHLENGELIINKTMVEDSVASLLAAAEGKPYIAHWRWGTSGHKNLANCHPFKVASDLYMAHNGVFHNVLEYNDDMSDTWHFIKQYVRPLYLFNHAFLQTPTFYKMLDKIAGTNKLAFLDKVGNLTLVNEKMGTWQGDIWLSNTYSLNSGYRSTKVDNRNVYNFNGMYTDGWSNWEGNTNWDYTKRNWERTEQPIIPGLIREEKKTPKQLITSLKESNEEASAEINNCILTVDNLDRQRVILKETEPCDFCGKGFMVLYSLEGCYICRKCFVEEVETLGMGYLK